MALIQLKKVMVAATRGHYAVGGFNFNGFEDAYGIAAAARAKNAPVILMASCSAARYLGLHTVVGMVRGISDDLGIDCVLHLDHATETEFIFECIRSGFTSVMIDASKKPFNENIKITRKVSEYAKANGVSVEAELGTIGGREEQIVGDTIAYTNPADVPEFVEKTGIDALAIAVGTSHGFYKEKPKLRFDLIREIARQTDIPLVLHGGTGISPEDLKEAVRCGISKINVGTELKYAFSRTVCTEASALPKTDFDPRSILKPVKSICQSIVEEKIELFGSDGKA